MLKQSVSEPRSYQHHEPVGAQKYAAASSNGHDRLWFQFTAAWCGLSRDAALCISKGYSCESLPPKVTLPRIQLHGGGCRNSRYDWLLRTKHINAGIMQGAMASSHSSASSSIEVQSLDKSNGLQAIRAALLMLVLFATVAVWWSLERLQNLAHHLEVIPVLLFSVVCIFAILVYIKAREMAGLRGAVQTLQSQQSVLGAELEAQKLLQTVAASRESFRDLVDSFDSAVFTLSLEGNVRAANKAFAALLDRPFSELIGKSIFDFISAPSAQQLQEALPAFLKTRHWSGLVRVCMTGTGQWKFFDCVLHPVLHENAVLAVTVIAKDVTAERDRENTFSVLFETLREAIWVTTVEGQILDSNRSLASLAGVDDNRLLNQNLLELILEPERQQMAEKMRNREIIHDLEVTLVRNDGSRAFCIANATPVVDVSGTVRYHGTFTDITQRRTAERKLAYEQNFREQLIASFPDAIITLSADGRITFASGRAERMFGKPAACLLNQLLIDLVDPQDELAVYTFLQDCLSLIGTVCTRELRLRPFDSNARRTVEISGTALQDSDCKLLGVVASVRDVTDDKQLESHLVASDRMSILAEAIRGASHELDNALTTIFGACTLLKDNTATAEGQKRVETLEGQASRVREIVQDLLLFAQPAPTAAIAVNLRSVIERSTALRRCSSMANYVAIDVQCPDSVPPVIGDPAQLVQVFLNLLLNAEAECLAAGKSVERIRIRVSVADRSVCCTLEVDGALLKSEPNTVPLIERQPDHANRSLTVAQTIVRAHGGNIDTIAEMGTHSAFRISLPALSGRTCS